MTRGQKVAGGDRLGKTIIFAKNNAHAEFIYDRFNANYPHLKGEFARIITHKTTHPQSLIDDFSNPEKAPHIAISVDMLDTGIDIPEVVNLVFFKLVRSKTKFWQMIGRGTRLSPDLFGPSQPKTFFYLFDYCQNLEYFSQNLETTEGTIAPSLSKRLFTQRLELLQELDRRTPPTPLTAAESPGTYATDNLTTEPQVRETIVTLLRAEVAAMNLDNFIVRPHRQYIEPYRQAATWQTLQPDDILTLTQRVAGLPTSLPSESEEAKRFDWLILNLQLAQLRKEPKFKPLSQQVQSLATSLETQNIPTTPDQKVLIQAIQTDEWWQDITIPMLENVRKRLRHLIRLIAKSQRQTLYTNFADELGEEIIIDLPGLGSEFDRFRAKAKQYLTAHQNHIAIYKLRSNQPLTQTDLNELERILLESGATSTDLDTARTDPGLGPFIRSLVGLDREAAKKAFGQLLAESTASANQIEFINLIIDYLTNKGIMDPGLLYEAPFTDLSAQGPEGILSHDQFNAVVLALGQIRTTAIDILAA